MSVKQNNQTVQRKPPCFMVDVDYQTLIRFSDKNGHWINNPKHEFQDFSLISFRDDGVKFLMEPVEIIKNNDIEIIWLSRDYMRQNTDRRKGSA